MRQQSFRHRGGTSRGIGGGILVALAVILGAFFVYYLILWFRSNNAKVIASDVEAASDIADVASVTASVAMQSTAVLKTEHGDAAGTVIRSGTVEAPSYDIIANLVGIVDDSSYEVWLVKDGLADVKSAGILAPRADGSWTSTFTVKDPLSYPTVVIMLEPNNGDPDPSGNRVAEGKFE